MNGLSAPKKAASRIAQIGGALLRPFRRNMKAKTDAELRQEAREHDLSGQFGALLVAFGLMMELVVAWRFRHGRTFQEVWYPVIGTFLIAFGVCLELIAHRRGAEREHELDRRSEKRVAAANLRAEQASLNAARAHRAAAEARERAAKAELALAEYRTPWRIMEDQFAKIVSSLRPFAPQMFFITGVFMHEDSLHLSVRLRALLKEAGWRDKHPGVIRDMGEWRDVRVEVFAVDDDGTKAAAKALADELDAIGIATVRKLLAAGTLAPQNAVRIAIGRKH